jgi:hypothetical protein
MLDLFEILERSVENSPEEKAASRKSHQEGDDELNQRDQLEHLLLRYP